MRQTSPSPLPVRGPSFSLNSARDVFSWRPAGNSVFLFVSLFFFFLVNTICEKRLRSNSMNLARALAQAQG